MNSFAYLDNSIDLQLYQAEAVIDHIPYDFYGYYIEDGTQSGNIFETIIAKAKQIVEDVKKKIAELFAKIAVKTKLAQAEQVVKENPELGKQKVKITDYDKLDKLNADTAKALEKSRDPEELMKKYRSQRNKILAASAAITISLSALLIFITKKKDQKIQMLEQNCNTLSEKLKKVGAKYLKMKEINKNLSEQNKNLNDKLDMAKARSMAAKASVKMKQTSKKVADATEKMSDGASAVQAQAKAQMEVFGNVAKDTSHSIKEALDVLGSDKSPLKKAASVANTAGDIFTSGINAVNGHTKGEVSSKNKSEIRAEMERIKEQLEKAKKVAGDSSKPMDRRAKAQSYIIKAERSLSSLKAQYRAL